MFKSFKEKATHSAEKNRFVLRESGKGSQWVVDEYISPSGPYFCLGKCSIPAVGSQPPSVPYDYLGKILWEVPQSDQFAYSPYHLADESYAKRLLSSRPKLSHSVSNTLRAPDTVQADDERKNRI